jgi:endonuclease-3
MNFRSGRQSILLISWLLRAQSFSTKSRVSALKTISSIPNGQAHWEDHWKKIEEMRSFTPAAVDTMGAEALANTGQSKDKAFRFQTLIGTMLSPQTKDQQTSIAFYNLLNLVKPNELLPVHLAEQSEENIMEAIQMVSFYRIKAKNIKLASEICRDKYDNDIPSTLSGLLAFQGVGPKVAYLTFSIAWDQNLGICVDTHVHRISNRLNWVNTWDKRSNGPEHTRKALEKFIPQEKWTDVNALLVGFGQTICRAKRPKCDDCSLQIHCYYNNHPTHMR